MVRSRGGGLQLRGTRWQVAAHGSFSRESACTRQGRGKVRVRAQEGQARSGEYASGAMRRAVPRERPDVGVGGDGDSNEAPAPRLRPDPHVQDDVGVQEAGHDWRAEVVDEREVQFEPIYSVVPVVRIATAAAVGDSSIRTR